MAAPRVTVTKNSGAGIVAGLGAFYGGLRGAARYVGISRGTLEGIVAGRQGMGEKTRQRLEAFLNDRGRISSADAKQVKDLGRAVEYTAAGRTRQAEGTDQRTYRSEILRLKQMDNRMQKREISYFVARQKELSGRPPRVGAGGYGGGAAGGTGGSGTETSSDEEWYAEYGAWVEEVEKWQETAGELPEVEELPF